jgi:hypothetical protein
MWGDEGAYLNALPSLLKVPQLNSHVITSSDDQRLSWVHGHTPDVVGVSLEGGNLLAGVVVERADEVVVRPAHKPVAPSDEAHAPHWHLSHLERLDDGLRGGIEWVSTRRGGGRLERCGVDLPQCRRGR